MKKVFKKVLIGTFAVSVLTGGAHAAANQIDFTGTVNAISVAGFADVSAESGSGVFADNAANSIDFGTIVAGETFAPSVRAVYIRTNNTAGAEMIVADGVNSGNLAGPGAPIAVAYTFNAAAVTLGTAFDLTTTTNAGSASAGDFVATPAASAADQTPGTYSTTLAVTIAAK